MVVANAANTADKAILRQIPLDSADRDAGSQVGTVSDMRGLPVALVMALAAACGDAGGDAGRFRRHWLAGALETAMMPPRMKTSPTPLRRVNGSPSSSEAATDTKMKVALTRMG